MNLDDRIQQGTIDTVEHLRDLEGGGREIRVRGRLYGRLSAIALGAATVALPQRSADGDAENRESDDGYEDDDEIPTSGTATIRGVASSTGVDWYGTEMSRRALDSMKRQMDGGTVRYQPTHSEYEWDGEIGFVRSALINEGDVPSQADGSDDRAFLLTSESEIDMAHPRSQALIRAMRRARKMGRSIGQSIGAWFTELRFVEDADGEIERVIIEDLEMDHLAATRSPANHESTGLEEMRARGAAAIRSACPRSTAPAPVPHPAEIRGTPPVATPPEPRAVTLPDGFNLSTIDQRHVLAAQDNGDGTFSIRLEISPDAGDVAEAEEEDDDMRDTRAAIPKQDLRTADRDTEWTWDTDAQDEVLGDGNWSRYRSAHVWEDPDADAETKAAYKLPIAKMVGGELSVVFRGVSAAMAALNGARGGVDIPDADRQGVYDVLASWYSAFDEEPPELQSLATDDSDAATRGGDTPNVEEIDMTNEELAALMERTVQAAVSAALAARTADGSGGDTPADDTPPEPATERERELLAQLEERDRALQAERRAAERLLDNPGSGRRAMAYDSPVMREVMTAVDDGDLSPLVTLCKEQNPNSRLVRTVESNRLVRRIFAAAEDGSEDDDQFRGKPISRRDLEGALKAVFRSHHADGGLQWMNPNSPSRRGWANAGQ